MVFQWFQAFSISTINSGLNASPATTSHWTMFKGTVLKIAAKAGTEMTET